MRAVSRKFPLKLLCLMVAGAWVQSAFARPAGPVIHAGSARYDAATLTLTATSARTQIGWKSFGVGAGEMVNFVLPDARSTVLNQVFDPQSLTTLGGISSNGSVLFMSNGAVYGPGATLDVAGLISTSLRLPKPALTPQRAGELAPPRSLATLAEGRIYVLGEDELAVTSSDGEVLLAPGRSVELVGAATPNLRVALTAPQAEAINLNRLIGNRRETGIFAALFRVPASARKAVQGEAEFVMTASSSPQMSEQERFYRYLAMYARMRTEMAPPEEGMVKVARAPGARTLLPAIKSRPSLLPNEIEIGAPKPQELEPRSASLRPQTEPAPTLAYAPADPPADAVATRIEPPVMIAAMGKAQLDAMPLSLAAAEPPAESVVQRTELLYMVAAVSKAHAEEIALSFASAEPPAAMIAARIEPPLMIAAVGNAMVEEARLSYPSVEPPASAGAKPAAQLVMVAAASTGRPQDLPLLDLKPADAQAQSEQTLLAPAPARHLTRQALSRTAPEVVVVAMTQQVEGAAPEAAHKVKEIRIERRIPRYFTDYRGAMFFM